MADKDSKVLFRTEYFDLVHDINATLVMSQIHYWYMPNEKGVSKLQVFKQGQWWLAKSEKDWWQETRLTKRQVERALSILVAANMIKVVVFQFGGKPTRHIVCNVLAKIPVKDRASFSPTGAFQSTYTCFPKHPEVQCITETTAETTTEIKTASDESKNCLSKNRVGKVEDPTPLVEKNMATANDILKNLKVKADKQPDKITPASLGMRWKKLLAAEGDFVKTLTMKQLGQLKHLHKSLGDTALDVVNYAVTNWGAFTWEVKAKKGLATAPTAPDIGFLQQYHDIAVQLIAKKSVPVPFVQTVVAVESPKPIPVAPKPVPAVESTPPEENEDYLATMAALEAIHPSS